MAVNTDERVERLAEDPEIRRLVRGMGVTHVDPETHTITVDPNKMAPRPRVLDVPAEERRLVTDGDPDELYPVPEKAAFERDFLGAKDLHRIADALIEANPKRFEFLSERCRMVYLWKAKGGDINGRATLGKCQKPGGLLKMFSGDAHYIIWLAADHARDLHLTRWQVEALLYHELCHTRWTERGAALQGHDFMGFRAELEAYGAWMSDLRLAAEVFQQLPLFDEAEDTESMGEE